MGDDDLDLLHVGHYRGDDHRRHRVAIQNVIDLTRAVRGSRCSWGGGEVASADGLRFVVPVRTLNAGHNPKYRGVTYYNFSSDQFTGFHAIVIPGPLRDSLFILDGLLEQHG